MPKPSKIIFPTEPAKPIEFPISKLHFQAHIQRTENCLLFADSSIILKSGQRIEMINKALSRNKLLVVKELKKVKIHLHTDLVWVWINERNLHQNEVLSFAKMMGYGSKVELAQAYITNENKVPYEWIGQLIHF
jgi:hypothetical protein